ncbi:MAG: DUF6131 family protein [Nocardioidaceae bacterium]
MSAGDPAGSMRICARSRRSMIILGIILLIIGLLVASLHVLVVIGLILLVVGLVLAVSGRSGRKVGGRSHWW